MFVFRMNKSIIGIYGFVLGALALLVLPRCAKVGMPSGGLKDSLPPVPVKADPPNYSINFSSNRIDVQFNEFIQLKNVNRELIISPPLEKDPVVRLRGKGFVVDLDAELRDSTTYTLNFGNAVADNNEGNVRVNYEYVFSTGSYLDSLFIQGKILHAFTHKPPEEPFFINLYRSLEDSVPLKEAPDFISKSREEGTFAINNLLSDTFRLFALIDANFNLIYDIREEPIAFLDSNIILNPEDFKLPPLPDTSLLTADTIQSGLTADSLVQDSIRQLKRKRGLPELVLYFFTAEPEIQYITDYTRTKEDQLTILFNRPPRGEVDFRALNIPDSNWYIREPSLLGDTISLWVVDSQAVAMDSIELAFHYYKTDSFLNLQAFTDTLIFQYFEGSKASGKKRSESAQATESPFNLNVTTIPRKGGVLDMNREYTFRFPRPPRSYDTSLMDFFRVEDTLQIPELPVLYRKENKPLDLYLKLRQEGGEQYKLDLYPGAFRDYLGNTNDTTQLTFSVQVPEHYGSIFLNLGGLKKRSVIQLLDKSDKPVRQKPALMDGSIEFPFLEPGEYRFRLFYDPNANERWDTGDYLEKKQPERAFHFEQFVNVRANWDLEVSWDLQE